MDASITKVLQAVQEEFPRKPRRQSSNHSNASAASVRSPSIPIDDDNSFPTTSELHMYSPHSPDQDNSSSFALSTSPASSFADHRHDGQQTPRADRTGPLSAEAASPSSKSTTFQSNPLLPERENVSSSSAMPDPTPAASSTSFKPNNTVNTQLPSNTSTAHQRSPKTRSAPSFISLPANAASSSNSTTSGFKLTTHQNEGLMLTPGGDDLPFVFKKRPNMQDRRPSREVFA